MIHFKRTFKTKSVPVKISAAAHGPNAYLLLYPADNSEPLMLVAEAREFAELLKVLATKLQPLSVLQADEIKQEAKRLQACSPNWDWLTPQMVVEYFSLSPVLRTHLADVVEVINKTDYLAPPNHLTGDVEALRPYLAEFFTEDGSLQRGYTRKAAGILFGDESANGGSNLKRIKDALKVLHVEFTTTTTAAKPGDSSPDELAA